MALRSPIYLDIDTLLSHAEYNDIEVPRQTGIVERTVRSRSGGGSIGISGSSVNATLGRDIERQSTYSLMPTEKATVSKVIDVLTRTNAIKVSPDGDTVLSKDDLVEIEGSTRITAASLAGKMFYVLRRFLDSVEDVHDLGDDFPLEQFKQVYLQNELLPIPILLELTGSDLPQKVYVNVRPDHFIEASSADRVEGEVRVLGTVSRLVAGGDEGYFSAEEWLLHDWEYIMRRKLMAEIGNTVQDLTEQLELDLPDDDVHGYITGPAVIVDAIALY